VECLAYIKIFILCSGLQETLDDLFSVATNTVGSRGKKIFQSPGHDLVSVLVSCTWG
jgi:hypothetical protein